METMFVNEFLKALGEGNQTKGLALLVIFFFIWLEVRGMKTQIKNISENIAKSFKAGEDRFTLIESRLMDVESKLKPKEG